MRNYACAAGSIALIALVSGCATTSGSVRENYKPVSKPAPVGEPVRERTISPQALAGYLKILERETLRSPGRIQEGFDERNAGIRADVACLAIRNYGNFSLFVNVPSEYAGYSSKGMSGPEVRSLADDLKVRRFCEMATLPGTSMVQHSNDLGVYVLGDRTHRVSYRANNLGAIIGDEAEKARLATDMAASRGQRRAYRADQLSGLIRRGSAETIHNPTVPSNLTDAIRKAAFVADHLKAAGYESADENNDPKMALRQ